MNLDRLQKIAIARLLSDLIEADFIVEQKEMALFEEIISKEGLNISEAMLVEAKKMDYGKAVSVLKELDGDGRREVVAILKKMSLSDGECARSEAIRIFAVEQALLNGAKVYSVPSGNVKIDDYTVLYVENEDRTQEGRWIEEEYDMISDAFAESGFSFVHIPHVVCDFSQMPYGSLATAVKYMIPSVSAEKVGSICHDLCEMTTSRFCRGLLNKKAGIGLTESKPSFLFKIGDSIIVDQFSSDEAERTDYSNFLLIELDRGVIDNLGLLLAMYKSMVSGSIALKKESHHCKFFYHGFHRSLFDLIAYGREQKEYRLVFNISRPQAAVYFEPVDGGDEKFHLKLTPQETTLFLLIARKSIDGNGLDWREQIPNDEKLAILAEYNEIYGIIGKGNSVTEYKDRTHTNHIKNRIRVLGGISNADLFIPEHVRSGNSSLYRIKADADHIRIILPPTTL